MHSPFPLYSPDALRALEVRGIAMLGGDAFALMAQAGQAAWRTVLKHWPQARNIVVVCGPGNNGGDGYVLARHALESGVPVRVLRMSSHMPVTTIAQRACEGFVAAGGIVEAFAAGIGEADLLVDALFGIGLSRAPDEAASTLIAALNAHPAPTFALDVPSGIASATGSAPGAAIVADRTLQFLVRHRGLRTGVALDHAGHLELATLDLPATAFDGLKPDAFAYRADALHEFFPLRSRDSHKGRNGHVLCIGGDHGSGGAILLAGEAALRCGAGLLSVATQASHAGAVLARRPEAMVHGIEHAGQLTSLIQRADVIAVGPGLGQGVWGQGLLAQVLACDKPRVFDADALNLLAVPGTLLTSRDVITPHPGEAARLLGIRNPEVQRDRFAAAQALAERYGATVVLKGAGSIIATQGQVPAVICAGNPGMAAGGMGDLLTGCIAALLAQGFGARDAAIAGALLHAAAGDAAARDDGERGLLPSDLLPWMRRMANPVRR